MNWWPESGGRRDAETNHRVKCITVKPVVLPIKFKFEVQVNAPVVGVLDGYRVDPTKLEKIRQMDMHLFSIKRGQFADGDELYRFRNEIDSGKAHVYFSTNKGTMPVSTVKIEEVAEDGEEKDDGVVSGLLNGILMVTKEPIVDLVPAAPTNNIDDNQRSEQMERAALTQIVAENAAKDEVKQLKQTDTITRRNVRSIQYDGLKKVPDLVKYFANDAKKQMDVPYTTRIDRDTQAKFPLFNKPVTIPTTTTTSTSMNKRWGLPVPPFTLQKEEDRAPVQRTQPVVKAPPVTRARVPQVATKQMSSMNSLPSRSYATQYTRPVVTSRPMSSTTSTRVVRNAPFLTASANVSVGYPL